MISPTSSLLFPPISIFCAVVNLQVGKLIKGRPRALSEIAERLGIQPQLEFTRPDFSLRLFNVCCAHVPYTEGADSLAWVGSHQDLRPAKQW